MATTEFRLTEFLLRVLETHEFKCQFSQVHWNKVLSIILWHLIKCSQTLLSLIKFLNLNIVR